MKNVNLAIDMERNIGELFVVDDKFKEENYDWVIVYDRMAEKGLVEEKAPYIHRNDLSSIHDLIYISESILLAPAINGKTEDEPVLTINGKTEDEILSQIISIIKDKNELESILVAYESSTGLDNLIENMSKWFKVK